MSEDRKLSFDEIEELLRKIESRVDTLKFSRGTQNNGPDGFIRRESLYFSSADIKMLREQELTREQEKLLNKLEKKMKRYY